MNYITPTARQVGYSQNYLICTNFVYESQEGDIEDIIIMLILNSYTKPTRHHSKFFILTNQTIHLEGVM